MYLKEIYLENTGPIAKCHVELPFADNGNPLPVVIVGPNGSGKSIFLSYIVDALTEFAKMAFRDIVPADGSVTPYFRIIYRRAIRSGQPFSLSLLRFKSTADDLYYCEKSGKLDPAADSSNLKSVFNLVWNWSTDKNHKEVSGNKQIVETEMRNGAHAFFPASRREVPDWLNTKSLKLGMNASKYRRFNDKLDKPLWIETCAEENISWILDVFLDSLLDLQPEFQVVEGRNYVIQEINSSVAQNLNNNIALRQGRNNVERILCEVLQDKTAELILNYRDAVSSRISIKMNDGRIIPNFHALSEGQSQLFHLFTTIIRYGERSDLNRSVHLSQITGLVVIDEIAAHLHPTLQHDVLPKLIKMFPKVQFIVSSHSPLFLLGMEKEFGSDGLNILELPNGNKINSERFTEFGKAFEYYQTTETFEEEVKQRFARGTKPLVLTEGPLDPLYIQAALVQLGHQELLNSFDIEFVGMEHEKGTRHGGDQGLNHFRNTYVANSSLFHRPILLLYDCDTRKKGEQIGKLWVRLIEKNRENTIVLKGIENLFPEKYFEGKFKKEYYNRKPKDDGGHSENLDKPRFCDWICKHGSAADFEKFDSVVEILKEFVEAHQSYLNSGGVEG